MERMEDDAKLHVSQLSTKVHEKTTESATLRLDNERLKVHLVLQKLDWFIVWLTIGK